MDEVSKWLKETGKRTIQRRFPSIPILHVPLEICPARETGVICLREYENPPPGSSVLRIMIVKDLEGANRFWNELCDGQSGKLQRTAVE